MGATTSGARSDYPNDVASLRADWPALADELAAFTGVGQVVEWMSARAPGRANIDLVAQDEFEYDFLVELGPGGEWLAFGVT